MSTPAVNFLHPTHAVIPISFLRDEIRAAVAQGIREFVRGDKTVDPLGNAFLPLEDDDGGPLDDNDDEDLGEDIFKPPTKAQNGPSIFGVPPGYKPGGRMGRQKNQPPVSPTVGGGDTTGVSG